MLIVAPLRPMRLVWPAEAHKWTDFHELKVAVLHGWRRDELLASDADVCVTNFESLDWITDAKWVANPSNPKRKQLVVDLRRFKALGFDTLVVDEVSRLKHYKSNRSRTVQIIANTFARRWGLTGTPAGNGLEGLFGQCLAIDGGRTFGPYITHFRARYMLPHPSGFGWLMRKGANDEIYERVKPMAIRLEARGTAPVVDNVLKFDLPPAARRVYDALEEEMVARIGERKVVAVSAGVASMKCAQVAEGGIYLDPDVRELLAGRRPADREWEDLHEEKVDLVEELVEELNGQPLLVAYDFRHGLERLKRRFKNVAVLGSGVSPKEEARIEAAWNANDLPILLGHPQSIGHGLNLQRGGARHLAFHSLSWDWELVDQMIRRLRRRGGADRVTVHWLVARDTVDEVKFWAVRGKAKTQDALLDALKNVRKR